MDLIELRDTQDHFRLWLKGKPGTHKGTLVLFDPWSIEVTATMHRTHRLRLSMEQTQNNQRKEVGRGKWKGKQMAEEILNIPVLIPTKKPCPRSSVSYTPTGLRRVFLKGR